MSYYKIEVFKDNAWETIPHWSMPLYQTEFLDGTLDFGRVEINAQGKTNLKPYIPIRITEYLDRAMTRPIRKTYGITQDIPRQRVGF